jgi:ABC-type uncharacterized transport system substrate-binding protein
MMRGLTFSAVLILLSFVVSHSSFAKGPSKDQFKGKKILYIDSYHDGYEWADAERNGVISALKGTGVELKVEYMDTKRHPEEAEKKAAGLKAKATAESFKPDVIIAADDNATKYVIEPYFKNAATPVVFCGVNWDSSKYGYPYKNATGIEEVDLVESTLSTMRKYSKGSRAGFIGGDNESERGNGELFNKRFFGGKAKGAYVKTFDDFKEKFLELQKETDFIIVFSNAGVKGWDDDAAVKFFREKTAIPTATHMSFMSKFVLVTYAKRGEEQGELAVQAALKILGGTSPSAIPITQNKKAKLVANLGVARRLGITLPVSILKVAEIFDPEKK